MEGQQKQQQMLLEQQQQFQENQQKQFQVMMQMFAGQQNAGASTSTHTTNSITTDKKNLSEQLIPFVYDPESNLTFDAWYKRYESIFTIEAALWNEPSKIQLLLQKFSQTDYQLFFGLYYSKATRGTQFRRSY